MAHLHWFDSVQMGRLGGIALLMSGQTMKGSVECGEEENEKLEHLRHEICFRFPS